jgi:hypothetical protein
MFQSLPVIAVCSSITHENNYSEISHELLFIAAEIYIELNVSFLKQYT